MDFMITRHYRILLALVLSGTLAVTGCGTDSGDENDDPNSGTEDAGVTDTDTQDSGEEDIQEEDIQEEEDPEILPEIIGEDTTLTNRLRPRPARLYRRVYG